MGRILGYARVSTDEQELALQIDALEQAGCQPEGLYTDQVSGSRTERPGLDACLAELTRGDTLVVWRLDRLGRSMSHLVAVIEDLRQRGVNFRSLQDGVIDTTTASGELMFLIFSALAQFERRLIQERTRAGLAAARSRGRQGGRPKKSARDPIVKMARELHQNPEISIQEVCQTLKISRSTFYRYLALTEEPSDPG